MVLLFDPGLVAEWAAKLGIAAGGGASAGGFDWGQFLAGQGTPSKGAEAIRAALDALGSACGELPGQAKKFAGISGAVRDYITPLVDVAAGYAPVFVVEALAWRAADLI